MKRLIAAAGLAAGVIAGFHIGGPEALAQSGDACPQLIDQTLGNHDSSTALRREIGDIASHDIEVHVVILGPGQVATYGQLVDYTDNLYDSCGTTNPNQLTIALADNPGRGNDLLDVRTDGTAKQDFSDSSIDDAKSNLGNNLDDESSPTETDMLHFIEDINPFGDQPPEQTDSTPTPNTETATETGKDSRTPSLPILPIAGGVVSLVLAAGVGSRVKRGSDIKKVARSSEELATQATSDATTIIFDASESDSSPLKITHPDDAIATRELLATLQEQLAKLPEAQKANKNTFNAQRRSIWPDKTAVDVPASNLRGKAEAIIKNAGDLKEALDALQTLIGSIDDKIATFGVQLNALDQAIQSLEQDGWDMGSYRTTYNDYLAAQQQIIDLKSKNYVERPAELIDARDDSVVADTETVQQLPQRLTAIGEKFEHQTTAIEQTSTRIDQATSTLAELKHTYDPSCTRDIDVHDERMAELAQAMQDRHQQSQPMVGVKSSANVQTAEELQKNIDDIMQRANDHAQAVETRQQLLARLTEELPATYSQLTQQAAEGLTTATEFGSDVEESTLQALRTLSQNVEQASQELSQTKPKLLELNNKSEDYGSELARLNKQAQTEAQEMRSLRSEIDSSTSVAAQELAELLAYVRSESDVDSTTENAARQIEQLATNTAADRKSLRQQAANLQAQIKKIQAITRDAHSDVQRAEDARAAAAAAKALRESQAAAARAAQQSAIHISSSSHGSSGPHHHGGSV